MRECFRVAAVDKLSTKPESLIEAKGGTMSTIAAGEGQCY